ncbi:ProQ/FINO family protein [Escherichia coli]|uniref:ProQ/FINO family protein n=1 Tax=Escherichia coli TaxID=562 RepID=UPI000C2338F7|nr:ProQ/FinO family protein [Escherichia coli]PJI60776.1 proQ/FINO family protein [Escherichia coli]PJI65328.1 proQ/FINO family protein [Escherichia coli]
MTTLTLKHKRGDKKSRNKKTDKVITAHKVMPDNQNEAQQSNKQKPAGKTPWRHMTRRQRKNRRRVNRLIELWPDLFNREAPKPLKVGIFDDMMQDIATRGMKFGPGTLRAALASYAQCPRYYRVLVAGGARYDLKGQPCGEVTPSEQQDAEIRLMALNERRKRQRQAAKEKSAA